MYVHFYLPLFNTLYILLRISPTTSSSNLKGSILKSKKYSKKLKNYILLNRPNLATPFWLTKDGPSLTANTLPPSPPSVSLPTPSQHRCTATGGRRDMARWNTANNNNNDAEEACSKPRVGARAKVEKHRS